MTTTTTTLSGAIEDTINALENIEDEWTTTAEQGDAGKLARWVVKARQMMQLAEELLNDLEDNQNEVDAEAEEEEESGDDKDLEE